jgi:hypothetical protein
VLPHKGDVGCSPSLWVDSCSPVCSPWRQTMEHSEPGSRLARSDIHSGRRGMPPDRPEPGGMAPPVDDHRRPHLTIVGDVLLACW